MKQVSKELIQEIADQLQAGFRCFLHKETHALISFPHEDRFASFDPSMWQEEIQAVKKGKGKYLEIQGMEAPDSFRVMEAFAHTVEDTALKEKLLGALDQKRSFARFKALVDQSGPNRDKWFTFRDEMMIRWVEDQLNG